LKLCTYHSSEENRTIDVIIVSNDQSLFEEAEDWVIVVQYGWLEIRIADTWTDHIRQHEYITKNIQVMENRIREFIKDCLQPIISHYIGKSPFKDTQ
jgi:hypothetical protein